MRIAIYARVNTDKDRQNPDNQIRQCKEYCSRLDWKYDVFTDFASGSKESRPDLDRMIQKIRKRKYKAVIVWRLDRLGRSLPHLLQLLEEFRNKGVQFISLTEGFDTTTPQGQLFFNMVRSAAV